MFWAIGVVTRTPKINRESQQNHNATHNAVEDKKHSKSIGPLSESGDFFGKPESGNHSPRTHNGLANERARTAAQGSRRFQM